MRIKNEVRRYDKCVSCFGFDLEFFFILLVALTIFYLLILVDCKLLYSRYAYEVCPCQRILGYF